MKQPISLHIQDFIVDNLNNYQEYLRKIHADKNYTVPESFLNVPFDAKFLDDIQKYCHSVESLEIETIFVLGIGGSSLGAQAMYHALKLLNHCKKTLVFVETIDPDNIHQAYTYAQELLAQKKNIIILVISKSGTTFEVVINSALFIELLKKEYKQDYKKYLIIITDQDSALDQLAKKHTWQALHVPAQVGGRFSIFSAAGLLPLALTGIPVNECLQGARDITDLCLSKNNTKNSALLIAAYMFHYYQKNMYVHDFFLESIALESLGKWCRQLFAESLGKHGKGILPTVSLATIDLHSMVQLYLGGPKIRTTAFMEITTYQHALQIPSNQELHEMIKDIQGKNTSEIFHIIMQAVRQTYAQENLPYYLLTLPEISPYYLGQYMQLYMLVILYVGKLLAINPFDQPQVELYKRKVREIVSHE